MYSPFLKKLALFVVLAMPIFADGQIITTFAGTGTAGYSGDGGQATNAQINNPIAIAVDTAGNIYLGEQLSHVVRKITPSGIITTIAGNGTAGNSGDSGHATDAQLSEPCGIVVDLVGNIYITDEYNNNIRRVSNTGVISTIAGGGTDFWTDGIAATDAIIKPFGIAIDRAGNLVYGDRITHRVRKINTSGIITTVAGTGTPSYGGDGGPATAANFTDPNSVAIDASGNIYTYDNNSLRIREINTAGIVNTIAGTGTAGFGGDGGQATAALINHGVSVSVDISGNLLLGDSNNNRIRKINLATGIITTLAGGGTGGLGDGGPSIAAKLNYPSGIAVAPKGNIYIADKFNNRVRMIKSTVGVNNTDKIVPVISLYPNPCNGTFYVTINAPTEHIVNVTVSNMAGETIYQTTGSAKESVKIALDAPRGLYIATVTTQAGVYSKPIVVL